jgi:hypothetical protein
MTPEKLAALKVICETAIRLKDGRMDEARSNALMRFHEAVKDPTTCLELLEEVERLRNQWNTRFNTLCGNCGKRYLGPRDERLHGTGKCNL